MWESLLFEFLTSYFWIFIDIRLHSLEDRKSYFVKYLLNTFIYLYVFRSGVGASQGWLAMSYHACLVNRTLIWIFNVGSSHACGVQVLAAYVCWELSMLKKTRVHSKVCLIHFCVLPGPKLGISRFYNVCVSKQGYVILGYVFIFMRPTIQVLITEFFSCLRS
jgi:hypothetical protein